MVAMKKIIALVLLLGGGTMSCAAVLQALPIVVAAVQDSAMILDVIERFVHSRPGKHDEVDAKIAKARAALMAALRTAQGIEKLDQAKVDAAFADFKAAYMELLVISGPLGVHSGEKLALAPGGLVVPEPVALTLKIPR